MTLSLSNNKRVYALPGRVLGTQVPASDLTSLLQKKQSFIFKGSLVWHKHQSSEEPKDLAAHFVSSVQWTPASDQIKVCGKQQYGVRRYS